MNWKLVVSHAGYEDQAECIEKTLNANNIKTLLQLENSVGNLGHICDVDIYSLVAAVRRVFSEGLPVEEEDGADQASETVPEEDGAEAPEDKDNGED